MLDVAVRRPDDGNLALGALLGFVCGCFGLAVVAFLAEGRQTRKGAVIGFAVQTLAAAVATGLRHVAA
jgi:hypothetical protein